MKFQNVLKGFIVAAAILFFQTTFAQEHRKQQSNPKNQRESAWVQDSKIKSETKSVYFPDHNVYYNVEKKTYLYKKGDNWQESSSVPRSMKKTDLAKAKKVESNNKNGMPSPSSKSGGKSNESKGQSQKQDGKR